MRIIAGKHRSRVLKTLEGLSTRPMMDRMKESVFNIIGPYFEEIEVLDLFGGSGALSLESISRGAKHSYIVDMNPQAIKIIEQNVQSLNEESSVTILSMDYKVALNRLENKKFDLIFLDPPYRLNIINDIIDELIKKNMMNDSCYMKGNSTISSSLNLIKNYCYGNSEVAIYQYLENK